MRIPRIYTPEALAVNATVVVDAQSARHLLSVLRFKPGAELIVFNGRGGEYRGVLLDQSESESANNSGRIQSNKPNKQVGIKSRGAKSSKIAEIALTEFIDVNRESPLEIELGIGISRGERMDWIVQKSTELGVKKIIPLFTERTEVKLDGERLDKKCAHWRHIAVSACEQSGRTCLPEVATPLALSDWKPQSKPRFVLDPRAAEHLDAYKNANTDTKPLKVVLLIGPEGGLSDTELSQCSGGGFVGVTLGPRVLRTETAPLVAITLCQALWGDL